MFSEEKYFPCDILLTDQISLLSLLCEILGNMCIVIVCLLGFDVINFGINLFFLIKPFFLHDPRVTTKILTLSAPIPQNRQTHSKNSSAICR